MTTKELLALTELDALATSLVGDGKSPNLFFVSTWREVKMVTTNPHAAYQYWCEIRDRGAGNEALLEDRVHGVICSIENYVDRDTTDGTPRTVEDEFYRYYEVPPDIDLS